MGTTNRNDAVMRSGKLSRQRSQLKVITNEITAGLEAGAGPVLQSEQLIRLPDKRAKKEPAKKMRIRKKSEKLVSDRYKLEQVLGEGGKGTVYKAKDLLLGTPVAIKILAPKFTRSKPEISTLKKEARIAMRLSHRHIVRLHNLQKVGERYFLVMEYVEGRSFRQILKVNGSLPLDCVVQITQACAAALSYAHEQGVVHKDLKPDNLLITEDGVLKIIDFGIACLTHAQRDSDFIVGTPPYMSPEQIRGESLDARTDIYSFGIIVYELLTGKPPLPMDVSPENALAMHPVELSGLAGDITLVLEKAVAANREDRWKSVADFVTALFNAVATVA